MCLLKLSSDWHNKITFQEPHAAKPANELLSHFTANFRGETKYQAVIASWDFKSSYKFSDGIHPASYRIHVDVGLGGVSCIHVAGLPRPDDYSFCFF